MRSIAWWLGAIVVLGEGAMPTALRGLAQDMPTQSRGHGTQVDPQRLVTALSSPDFRARETAARELDRLGSAAVGPLRQAARAADAETRRRAAALIERINRRLAAERILTPTYVDLNFDHTPLIAAVEDLARRTGLGIVLNGEAEKLGGRTVTLAAEKVTAWQAVRLFCHRAGLHEWDGFSPTPGRQWSSGGSGTEGMLVLGEMLVRRGQVGAVTAHLPPARVVLVDGPGPEQPSHQAGSVRIRSAPPGATFLAEAINGKDALIALHILAEPRLHADGAADLRIERVLDDRGQEVTGRPVWPTPADDREDWQRGARAPAIVVERKHGPVAIAIPLPTPHENGAPKRLRELSGVVTVQAFVGEPVIEIARPAEAVGRTSRAGDVTVSLAKWTPGAAGEIRVTVETKLPYGTRLDQPVADLASARGRGGRFGGGWAGIPFDDPEPVAQCGDSYQGITVVDAAGKRFAAENGVACLVGLFPDNYTARFIATFRPPAAGADAARLIFAVQRPTALEVPFVLRDVLLP